jgi:large subunit ribosomal protein L30
MSPGSSSRAGAPGGHLRITQVRSAITTKPKHRGTLRALGLRGVGRSRVLSDSPELQGMLSRVRHLVDVVPASADEADEQRARLGAARQARARARGEARSDTASAAPAARTRATKARTRPTKTAKENA